MQAFPDQAKSLRPENSKAGGVKARSSPGALRADVYRAIRDLWMENKFVCEVCHASDTHVSCDLHHVYGREGYNLFNPDGFMYVCRNCHMKIHNEPAWAKSHGYLK